jgi:predicted RNA-binding Zn-ribbon protein involved in translation (DUF1610 family)
MAEAYQFTCTSCSHSLGAWSDGNPYYIDSSGKKEYAYHPDHDGLARCIGNDDPNLCLGCGAEVMVDSRSPIGRCPQCDAARLVPTWSLEGKRCPFCRSGDFRRDADFFVIS